MRKKRAATAMDALVYIFVLAVLAAAIWFALTVWQQLSSEKKMVQEVVPLGRYVYDQDFMEEAKKLPGICSVTPVCEVPVRLRVEDYEMEAVWTGVDFSVLQVRASQTRETPLGSRPVLLLGKDSLSLMTDQNGQPISEKRRKELIQNFSKLTWQYQILESAKEGQEQNDRQAVWQSCVVAAALEEPGDRIYVPFAQAAAAKGGSAVPAVEKILLTVRGKDHYKKVLAYFEGETQKTESVVK